MQEGGTVTATTAFCKLETTADDSHERDDMDIDERLIQLIKFQPHLYDFEDKKFRDVRLKQECWQAIAETLKIPLEVVNRRWKNLRDRFTRERRLTQRSSNGPNPYITRWTYYEEMSFFSPYLKGRRRYTKYPGLCSYEDALLYVKECNSPSALPSDCTASTTAPAACADNVDMNSVSTPSEIVPSSPGSTAVEDETTMNEIAVSMCSRKRGLNNDQFDEWEAYHGTKASVQSDECYYFGMYIGATLKRLMPRMRSTAKIRILEVLHEVEFNTD